MKSRKNMDHNQLISETSQQLHFFKPPLKNIKRAIENLIEKEYIERNIDKKGTYTYIS